MLVIMVGGIDLSMAASISLLANIWSVSPRARTTAWRRSAHRPLSSAVLIGLVNGLLVAVVEFNPLIVTLSMKFDPRSEPTPEYRLGIANSTTVPELARQGRDREVCSVSARPFGRWSS